MAYDAEKFETVFLGELVGQILTRAADLIEERGWVKGYMKGPDGFCAVGALAEATREKYQSTEVGPGADIYDRARVRLSRMVGHGSVMSWNDTDQSLTKEKVITEFRRAARG